MGVLGLMDLLCVLRLVISVLVICCVFLWGSGYFLVCLWVVSRRFVVVFVSEGCGELVCVMMFEIRVVVFVVWKLWVVSGVF